MSTDRELLELAARAYWGSEIDDVCSIRWLEDDQAIGYTHGDNQDHNGQDREFVWNPLEDSAAALELACKLCIDIEHNPPADQQAYIVASRRGCEMMYAPVCIIEDVDGYREAATRRAVVRAAAEIGRAGGGG